ncbi:aromatic amino acid DMT transporter YddG [Herbaspirillum sp. alder98]|uniref:aromatic amino acid DMT transporter YddG n=1 Tax=Herbaspirillum sp. alder98 TaxID=2913096 RepID=UPI001CD8B169|nr:aromatic amino acid DMT transporter YddG [Herbaspirillum sp. alder98]MCA1323801.1 aromatic amino acid DMT transporter YddG [Herbaspirillum sp. alder98]
MRSRSQATLIGLTAVLLWSFIVGLIRAVADHWGAVTGAALIYSLASVLLLATLGFPRLRAFPRAYLFWGSVLFVVYELCLSLSIGYASNARQAIEVGMVNYLWPTFTLVAAILFNQQKSNALVIPGFILSMLGICWVLGGEQGIDLPGMLANLRQNPFSYGLAFAGALIWAAYCTVTARLANGKNGVTLFFLLVALALWVKVLVAGDGPGSIVVTWPALVYLVLAAAAMGLGYAAWNVGILQGNVTVLAGASYFIPVISAALSALLLEAPLTAAFWQGAAMVCGGALLCWVATRSRT